MIGKLVEQAVKEVGKQASEGVTGVSANLNLDKVRDLKDADARLPVSSAIGDAGAGVEGIQIGGKSVEDWEAERLSLGNLADRKFDELSQSDVGVYIMTDKNGDIVYIGRALEVDNRGMKKRLSDYTREGDSGRLSPSGQLINESAAELKVSVIITGQDARGVEPAKALERALIQKYNPKWNSRMP